MKQIGLIPFLFTSLFFITSCGEDRSGEYYALIGDNLWIEQIMEEHYLWNDQLGKVKEEDFFTEPESFLQKLVYTQALNGKGDKYSHIESKQASARSLQRNATYGFDFELTSDPTGTTSHTFARILYTLPQSPASEAGLKRGDWLSAIEKEEITSSNYTRLMSGEATRLARRALVLDETGNPAWGASDTVAIGASRPMELNPFFLDTLYTVAGKKIAYLVYHEFSTGPDNQPDETTYREQMKQIFAQFKRQSPDAFILDLRYNPGGYLTCATDLGSYLAPAADLGKPFCTLQYNATTTPQQQTLPLNTQLAAENLNLSKLYVLTSSFTASASEAVINCLRPYLGAENVVTIGETTVGKPVATVAYEDERYDFILHPVVAYVHNAEGVADYADGIAPNIPLTERNLLSHWYPLGDVREYLLKNTLSYITSGTVPDRTQPAAHGKEMKILRHSLTHKPLQGAQLP